MIDYDQTHISFYTKKFYLDGKNAVYAMVYHVSHPDENGSWHHSTSTFMSIHSSRSKARTAGEKLILKIKKGDA